MLRQEIAVLPSACDKLGACTDQVYTRMGKQQAALLLFLLLLQVLALQATLHNEHMATCILSPSASSVYGRA